MHRTTIPLATVLDGVFRERLVRQRSYHPCGQLVWMVETPEGWVCYAELRPNMSAPLTVGTPVGQGG